MIHWAWLIPAFILGILTCYGLLYLIAKDASGLLGWLNKKDKG